MSNALHFQGATHTTSSAGYEIIKILLSSSDKNKGTHPSSYDLRQ